MNERNVEEERTEPPASGAMLGLSRNALIAIAVLAVLAVVGWWRAIDKSSALTALEQVKGGLDQQVAELQGQVTDLKGQAADLQGKVAATEKANGDLDDGAGQARAATSGLNERLAVLGRPGAAGGRDRQPAEGAHGRDGNGWTQHLSDAAAAQPPPRRS